MSRLSARGANVVAVGSLLLLASLFLGPRMYWDRALLLGDRLYYTDPTFRAAFPDVHSTHPHNPVNDVDHSLQFYPHLAHMQQSLSQGEIPWWNPYVGMGVPGIGIGSSALDPVTLGIGWLTSLPTLANVRALTTLVIGGYGVYVLTTALGASHTAALLAAVAWAFSGWSIAWLGRGNMLAEMWMPWLLWSVERLLRRPTVGLVGVAALAAGFCCLAGHPQTTVHIFAVVGVCAAAWAWNTDGSRSAKARGLGLVALALGLGIVMGLVQLVPMGEMIAHADLPAVGRGRVREAADALAAAWYGLRGDGEVIARDFPTAITLLAPTFLGNPVDLSYWWPGYNTLEMMVYPGLVPLFFAGYAAIRRRVTDRLGVWFVLAIVAFGVAYALPVFNVANYLPVFGWINNGRLRFVVRFAIILVAAFGLDRFIDDLTRCRLVMRWCLAFALMVIALPAVTYVLLQIRGYAMPPAPTLIAGHLGAVIIVATLVSLTVLTSRAVIDRRGFAVAIVALAFLDSLWHLGDFTLAVPRDHVYPNTPVVKFLKSDQSLHRVSSGPAFMLAMTKLPYRIFDVDMFDVLSLRRYTALQQKVNGRDWPPDTTARYFVFPDPVRHRGLMSLMNIKYAFMPPRGQVQHDRYAALPWYRVAYDREVLVYENLDVLPRAFLVDRAIVTTPDAALATLTRADFDPRAAVLLEAPDSPPLHDGVGRLRAANVTLLSANRVIVNTDAPWPAYVVFSEVNYPGWQAQVDGQEATIYQANYLFRAVHVPAGHHQVALTFMPTSYRVAIAGTLLAAILIAGCLIWGVRRLGSAATP